MSKQNTKKPAGKRTGAPPRSADAAKRRKRVATWLVLALVVVGAGILVAGLRQPFRHERDLDRFTAHNRTTNGCGRRDR